MKTRAYWQLSRDEQIKALESANRSLMSYAYEGVIEIQMPTARLKSDFELALKLSRRDNSLDKFIKLVAGNPAIQKELNRVCVIAVEGSRYADNGFAIIPRS